MALSKVHTFIKAQQSPLTESSLVQYQTKHMQVCIKWY